MSAANSFEAGKIQPVTWQRRLGAILEICGVYMVGQLIAFILIQLLGITVQNPFDVLKANPDADLLEMSKNLALILLFQYGGIMLPALGIGWWHRKRRLGDYGLRTAGQPIAHHLWMGVVLFAAAELPAKLLTVVDRFFPLGAKAFTQELVYNLDWGKFDFWVFMAVGSFLLIPLVEEFFYRGYVQTRLGEDFDAPTAILTTALFFAFSHGQYYLSFSLWNVGMILTIIFSALAWGYVFYKTRSLIAPIVAHALINFPVRGVADYILPVAMFLIVLFYRQQILAAFRSFGDLFKSDILSKAATVAASLGLVLFAIFVAAAEDVALLLGILALIIALVLEFVEKRRLKKQSA